MIDKLFLAVFGPVTSWVLAVVVSLMFSIWFALWLVKKIGDS